MSRLRAPELRLPISRSASAPSIPPTPSSSRPPPAPAKPTCSPAAFSACWPRSKTPARSSPSPSPRPPPPRCATASLHELEEAAASTTPRRNPDAFSMESLAHRALAPLQAARLESPRSARPTPHLHHRLLLPRPRPAAAAALRSRRRPRHLRAARRALSPRRPPDTRTNRRRRSSLCARHRSPPAVARQQLAGDGRPPRRDARASATAGCTTSSSIASRIGMHCASASNAPSPTPSRESLAALSQLLDQVPGAREEALTLARFACEQGPPRSSRHSPNSPISLTPPFSSSDDSRRGPPGLRLPRRPAAHQRRRFRKQVDKRLGFPADRKREKARLLDLIARLSRRSPASNPPSPPSAPCLPPATPTKTGKSSAPVSRSSATPPANSSVVFAEAGAVDYIEVAQIALNVLQAPTASPPTPPSRRRRRHPPHPGRRVPGHQPPPARAAPPPHRRLA